MKDSADKGNWSWVQRLPLLSSNPSLACSVLFAWIKCTDCVSTLGTHGHNMELLQHSDSRDLACDTASFMDPEQGGKQTRCFLAFTSLTKLWKTCLIFLTIVWNDIYPWQIKTGMDLTWQLNQQHCPQFLQFKVRIVFLSATGLWSNMKATKCGRTLPGWHWRTLTLLILQVMLCNVAGVFATRQETAWETETGTCGSSPSSPEEALGWCWWVSYPPERERETAESRSEKELDVSSHSYQRASD